VGAADRDGANGDGDACADQDEVGWVRVGVRVRHSLTHKDEEDSAQGQPDEKPHGEHPTEGHQDHQRQFEIVSIR